MRSQVVRCLGGQIGDVRRVPCGDLRAPAHDRAAELADLGRIRVVLEIVAEPDDELERESRVAVVIDGADDLLSAIRRFAFQ
jgi:hypothetical protein